MSSFTNRPNPFHNRPAQIRLQGSIEARDLLLEKQSRMVTSVSQGFAQGGSTLVDRMASRMVRCVVVVVGVVVVVVNVGGRREHEVSLCRVCVCVLCASREKKGVLCTVHESPPPGGLFLFTQHSYSPPPLRLFAPPPPLSPSHAP